MAAGRATAWGAAPRPKDATVRTTPALSRAGDDDAAGRRESWFDDLDLIEGGERWMATPMLTDSGLETWLVFHRNTDLPHFAAFPLLDDPAGRGLLEEYFRDHLLIAAEAGVDIVLETPTWRANADWGARVGYDATGLDRVNRDAVAFLREISSQVAATAVVVSGCIGPRGDGYSPDELLSPDVAEKYHRAQIGSFVAAGADRVTMLTATHTGEAIGVVRAAVGARVPVVIAFTVETDGRLPSGQPLHEAIAEVDAQTTGAALHFGINCAHPDHFTRAVEADSRSIERIALLRANASRASHAELDAAEELDEGNPIELGDQYAALVHAHPHFHELGGCCGTDGRHVQAIARACTVT
jgi:homocysteine S-methyltransferase